MKTNNKLFIIAILGLNIAGFIFVLLSIFGKIESNWILPAGLFCVVLGNLFNLIRIQQSKKEK
ncbi:MAG: hypothetical protein Q4C49_06685 [Bacillota bacterium]|nr:hypothetical protein [Bacillota bacterium]